MKKNKWLTGLIMASSALALVGVGFSSWVINNSSKVSENVTVNFGTVTDNSISCTLIGTNDETEPNYRSDLTVRFDATQNCDNGVVTNPNSDTEYEDLIVKVNYNISSTRSLSGTQLAYTFNNPYASLGTSNYLDFTCLSTFTITLDTTSENYYTGSLSTGQAVKVTYTDESTYKTARIETTFTFGWGSVFNNENPCDVTSGESGYADLGENLLDFQEAYKLISGNIQVTITPTAGTAA